MQTEDFLREAYSYAMDHSDDPNTWVGAIIKVNVSESKSCIAARAANKYIGEHAKKDSYEYPERFQSPEKYNWIEHAERGAIYHLTSINSYLHNAEVGDVIKRTMYAPWAACIDCARAIVLGRIHKLVIHKQAMDRTPSNWTPSLDKAFEILKINNVEVEIFDGVIGNCTNLMQGKIWYP